MRLYLDASAIIYSLEGVAALRQAVLDHVQEVEDAADGMILTSRLSRLECRVLPLRRKQDELLLTYETFFSRKSLVLGEITASVIERATDMRARHGLKTPDAIHVATAMELQADMVLTGDRDLARCTGIKVIVL